MLEPIWANPKLNRMGNAEGLLALHKSGFRYFSDMFDKEKQEWILTPPALTTVKLRESFEKIQRAVIINLGD